MIIKPFNESKQVGTLYHVCAIDGMKHIAETNTLESKKINLNKALDSFDVVSFTRNKRFIAWTRTQNDFLFRIAVDGDKLSEHHKIIPYNDFFDNKKAPVKTQFEECVEGTITDFSKYILSVDFMYTDKFFKDMDDQKFGYYLINLKKIDWYLRDVECNRVSFPKDSEGYGKVITSRGLQVKDPAYLTKKQKEKIEKAKELSSQLSSISLREFTDELINNYMSQLNIPFRNDR